MAEQRCHNTSSPIVDEAQLHDVLNGSEASFKREPSGYDLILIVPVQAHCGAGGEVVVRVAHSLWLGWLLGGPEVA
jgi:hypothetical protein